MGRLFLDFRNFRQHEPDLSIFYFGEQKGRKVGQQIEQTGLCWVSNGNAAFVESVHD